MERRMAPGPYQDPPEGSGDEPEPEEVASEGALAVAETCFAQVAAGDAEGLWSLFSEPAQAYILNVGHERGMDFDLTSRLRAGAASSDEHEAFLSDVLAGIRRDLAGIDFARLAFDSKAEPEAPMQVRVHYLIQMGPDIPELLTAIPAGSLVLSLQPDGWRVERLVPRPGGEPPGAPVPGGPV